MHKDGFSSIRSIGLCSSVCVSEKKSFGTLKTDAQAVEKIQILVERTPVVGKGKWRLLVPLI